MYREYLMGFSHMLSPGDLTTPSSQGCTPELAPTVGKVVRTYNPGMGRDEELLIACVWLTAQPWPCPLGDLLQHCTPVTGYTVSRASSSAVCPGRSVWGVTSMEVARLAALLLYWRQTPPQHYRNWARGRCIGCSDP